MALIFGLVLLALLLWALHAFTKIKPQTAAVALKTGGGLGALAVAGLLGARGRLDIAIPLGLTGLGLLGVPAFMFQEGGDPITEQAFREIARLTRGAYCRFDPGAAHQLAELLRAAAAYAAGGMRALVDLSARRQAGALKLLEQMRS